MTDAETYAYETGLRVKGAILDLNFYDFEQLFINNDFEDLEDATIDSGRYTVFVSGSCITQDHKATFDGGRQMTPGETSIIDFDVTGSCSDDEGICEYKFMFGMVKNEIVFVD